MPSTAIAAYATTLKIGSTAIAEVTKLDFGGLKLDTVEATSHASTGGWREYIPTLLDAGEVSFEISYVPTATTHKNSAGGLIYIMANKTLTTFNLVWSDATTTWTFSAYVTGFKPSAPVDGKLAASVTLKISGAPTLV